ncbi:membrane protein [Streptomyces badius]
MSKPIRMSRRTWVAAWVVLCAAGLAATSALQASSASKPRAPAESVSAQCDELIAEVKKQLAKAEQQREEEAILAFSGGSAGTLEDCDDELRSFLLSNQ